MQLLFGFGFSLKGGSGGEEVIPAKDITSLRVLRTVPTKDKGFFRQVTFNAGAIGIHEEKLGYSHAFFSRLLALNLEKKRRK